MPLEKDPVKPGPLTISQVKRHFFGATYLFNQIDQLTGVEADLKQIFFGYLQTSFIVSLLLNLRGEQFAPSL